jgi:hypothetical protein
MIRRNGEEKGRKGVHLIISEVNGSGLGLFLHDGLDEQTGSSDVELVVHCESFRVVRKLDVLRSAFDSHPHQNLPSASRPPSCIP